LGLTFVRDHRPAGLKPAVTTIEIATQRQRLFCRKAHHQCLTLKADSGWDRVGTGNFGTPIAIDAIGDISKFASARLRPLATSSPLGEPFARLASTYP